MIRDGLEIVNVLFCKKIDIYPDCYQGKFKTQHFTWYGDVLVLMAQVPAKEPLIIKGSNRFGGKLMVLVHP